MSKQTVDDVFAQIDAEYKKRVIEATWGHLAPQKSKTYSGRIVYAVGCYEHNPNSLVCEFKDLDDSPWFFDAMMEFISSQDNLSGCVYEFTGTFRNYTFKGTTKLLKDYNCNS